MPKMLMKVRKITLKIPFEEIMFSLQHACMKEYRVGSKECVHLITLMWPKVNLKSFLLTCCTALTYMCLSRLPYGFFLRA